METVNTRRGESLGCADDCLLNSCVRVWFEVCERTQLYVCCHSAAHRALEGAKGMRVKRRKV